MGLTLQPTCSVMVNPAEHVIPGIWPAAIFFFFGGGDKNNFWRATGSCLGYYAYGKMIAVKMVFVSFFL